MTSLQTPENLRLAQAIDHTKLTFGPDEDETQSITQLCSEAKEAGFYAVCVRPQHITLTKECLAGSPVKVAAVIGFPLQKTSRAAALAQSIIGHFSTAEKVQEAHTAIVDGADELDVVINIHQLKADLKEGTTLVFEELKALYQVASAYPIKVIIETDLLSKTEIQAITKWCAAAQMGMVKTSTGMISDGQGATLENIRLIRQELTHLKSQTGIKASGGIKSREQALLFLNEGVNRLGTSSGCAILQNKESVCQNSVY